MMTRISRILTHGLLAGLSSLALAQQEPGLNSLAQAAGKLFFGTATDTNNFNDSVYQQIVADRNEFGILVPENSQKWQPTEPAEDDFSFTSPDQIRALATKNGQMFRCHTLTWFQQLPQFITTTAWTRDTLTAAIQTHISNVVGHYRGACYSWDVVNEALNDGNGTFRTSVFFNTLGTDFIPISFRAAAAADPNAKLYYNDFSLEFNSSKTDAALDIVRLVQNSGARIDGVGFQGHFTAGGTPSARSLAATFGRFVSLGVEVAVTELDVRLRLPADAASVAQQARDYQSVVGACLGLPECVGIVVWQFSDKYSWVPSTFAGTGDACLYDSNLQRKPVWTSVSAQLAAAAATATAAAAKGALLPTGRPSGAVPTASGVKGTVSGAAKATGAVVPSASGIVQVSGSERVVVGMGALILAAMAGGAVLVFA